MKLISIFSTNFSFKLYIGKCHKEYASYQQRKEANGGLLVGAHKPDCEDNGDFKPKQCNPSTGYCWCVNTLTGVQIIGTAKQTFLRRIDCSQYASKFF